jgi:hypothetical protein
MGDSIRRHKRKQSRNVVCNFGHAAQDEQINGYCYHMLPHVTGRSLCSILVIISDESYFDYRNRHANCSDSATSISVDFAESLTE